MTHVSLEFLFGLVTDVRDAMLGDYRIDELKRLEMNRLNGERWIVPLMSAIPHSETTEQRAVGAFHFYRIGHSPKFPAYEGCGTVGFELLPRMPESAVDPNMCSTNKAIARISAGKDFPGGVGHTARFTQVTLMMSDDNHMIHHLPLVPVAIDLLSRFAQQVRLIPSDVNWREDRSDLIAA